MEYKSKEELYFSFYLEELKEAGYVKSWGYEVSKFQLTEPYSRSYLKQLKTKVKEEEEFLLHGSSITADFTINWRTKADGIFVLDDGEAVLKVKDIPFRFQNELSFKSQIEVKAINESKTSSSYSFPYKQKFCLYLHNVFIQKIKPFDPEKKCLFSDTFVPDKVLQCEKYKRDSKHGKKGESKIKYKIKTLEEFVDGR